MSPLQCIRHSSGYGHVSCSQNDVDLVDKETDLVDMVAGIAAIHDEWSHLARLETHPHGAVAFDALRSYAHSLPAVLSSHELNLGLTLL